MATLKAKVMAALRNADGTPIKELDALFTNKNKGIELQRIFGTQDPTPKSLLNAVNDKFDRIFKIVE